MDFEKQKPISDEYRDNYERVFGRSRFCHFWRNLPNGTRICEECLKIEPQKDTY